MLFISVIYVCDMNRNILFCPSSLKIQNKRIVLFSLNVEKFLKGTHFVVNMKIYLLSNKEYIFNKRLTNIFVELKMRKWSMNKYQIFSLKRRFYLSQEF